MRVVQTIDGVRNLIACDLCGDEFQFGPHRYAGRKVVAWNVMICEMCDSMNHDGLDPGRHVILMRRLKEGGTPLRELQGGFIAIPPYGH
jgi:hypothetical protein